MELCQETNTFNIPRTKYEIEGLPNPFAFTFQLRIITRFCSYLDLKNKNKVKKAATINYRI